MARRPHRWAAIAAALALPAALAGCGGAPPATGAAPAVDVTVAGAPQRTTYPLTIENCGRQITFTGPPQRVLILNGTSVAEVESMLALGLGDEVVANAQRYGVSDQPGLTSAIDALPTGGLTQDQQFDVPAEQVLASAADLVLSTWSGGFDASTGRATRDQLAAAGKNTLVTPVNCSMGKPDASAEEQAANAGASPRSSLEYLLLLGQVFDVQDKAHAVARELAERITRVSAAVAGAPAKKLLVAYPGMSMMNSAGLPAVLTGGIYDRVLNAAGTVPSFTDVGADFTSTLNAEQLAAAEVDLLVLGAFTPNERPAEDAARLFAAYPQWAAAKNNAWVAVSDGMYLGTTNAWAIEKIAKAAHPDRF